jgi:hypothetical protein
VICLQLERYTNEMPQVLAQYHLDRMKLHDVAVTQDRQRMLCVGVLMASEDGLQPKRCKAEKQILGKNNFEQGFAKLPNHLFHSVQPREG